MKNGLLERSARAVEELFAIKLGRWSHSEGRFTLAEVLGVSPSRLRRAMVGATPSLDLAWRLHSIFDLSWPDILTSPPTGTPSREDLMPERAERGAAGDPDDFADVEERIRRELRGLLRERGVAPLARDLGVPRSTLHSYCTSTRISLSLIWRLHLLSDTPYSTLISGTEDPEERRLAEGVGSDSDRSGRFRNLQEPIIRLAEVYAHNEAGERATPWVDEVAALLRDDLSVPQRSRLLQILAHYGRLKRRSRVFPRHMRQDWDMLRGGSPDLKLRHLRVAAQLHMFEHARKVADHILKRTDSPDMVALVQRVLSRTALQNLQVHDAARLARTAAATARSAARPVRGYVLASTELVLAVCAWLLGDFREALTRAAGALRSTDADVVTSRHARHLQFHVRIWLGEWARAGQGRDDAGVWSIVAPADRPAWVVAEPKVFRLRTLLEKGRRDTLTPAEGKLRAQLLHEVESIPPGSLWPEPQFLQAVCLARGGRSTRALRRILRQLVRGEPFEYGVGLFSLPDFFESVDDADLWTPDARRWRRRAEDQGLLFFNMTRPGR